MSNNVPRFRNRDDDNSVRGAEEAESISVAVCDVCLQPHLYLRDAEGYVFAVATLSREVCMGLVAYLQKHLHDGQGDAERTTAH